jgi:hypothetical protein
VPEVGGTQRPPDSRAPTAGSIWLRIFACLGIVVMACGLKQSLTVLVSGTDWCRYLCPSPFPSGIFFSYPLLESLYEVQRWAQDQTQALFDRLYADPWNWNMGILIAPVYANLPRSRRYKPAESGIRAICQAG